MERIRDSKELGELARERRKERMMTQRDLAMFSNTGVRFISYLENDKPTTLKLGVAE